MANMYRCYHCGRLFDYPAAVEEPRGEFWGTPCTETVYYSPCCEDDFDEVEVDEDGNILEEEA